MDRKRIENIMNKLKDIDDISYDDEFNIAVYIYFRYGIFEFNNYICENELIGINKILKRYNTILNEDINDEVSIILNEEAEE